MNFPDFLYRFVGFSSFLVNALVCVLAASAYQATRKRCLLLIAVSAGMAGVTGALPAVAATGGWGAWYLDMVMRVAAGALSLVGCWLLFQSYTDLVKRGIQGSKRNGSLAKPLSSSNAAEGPPLGVS